MNTFIRQTTVENFEETLLQMVRPENEHREMVFSSNLIDAICREHQYPCYQFAHMPNGNPYMRARIKKITLEYIVMENPTTQDYNSYVFQIFSNGQLIYRRPDNPIGTICVTLT